MAVEIGIEDSRPDIVFQFTAEAIKGELPILIHVPMTSSMEIILAIAEAGAAAISLGPPRGSLPALNGEVVSGRLFGPSLFPTSLQAVSKFGPLVDIPVIASGGLYGNDGVKAILDAGASAVQFDGILWTEPEGVLGDPTSSMDKNKS